LRRPASGAGRHAAGGASAAERLQKVLAQLGLGSRREAEDWIRAGRLSVNGRPAVLGMRVSTQDQLRLDGRLIRQRAASAGEAVVLLCHRSPGQPLLPPRARRITQSLADPASSAPAPHHENDVSFAEQLPRRIGRRFISISPLATADGGLELLSSDGTLAARLQRAVGSLPMEFTLRVRGELSDAQRGAIQAGQLDSGAQVRVEALEPAGGEGSNRWYRLVSVGASGAQLRQLIERQAVTLTRALRVRVGPLALPPTLARGRWQPLSPEQISALLDSPATAP